MASIYFKFRKEPLEIDNARAKKIKEMKYGNPAKGIKPMEPSVSVDFGELSCELDDIRRVELTKEVRREEFPTLSEADITKLDTELKKFTKKEVGGRMFYADDFYLQQMGATRIRFDGSVSVVNGLRYREVQDKLAQWREWRDNRAFGEKKKLEQLDELGAKMRVPYSDDIDTSD